MPKKMTRKSPAKRKTKTPRPSLTSTSKRLANGPLIPQQQVVQLRAYDGASRGRRTENWRTPNTSANAETFTSLVLLRARARDLVRNNGFAGQAVNELVGNTVGTGIMAKITAPQKNQQEKLKKVWSAWAETENCDADGQHDLYGIQNLATRSLMESGEVLIRRRWRRASDGLPVPFQLQVLEPDFIDTTKNVNTDSGPIIQGVQYDLLGRRVGYWLFPEHPGGQTIYSTTLQSKFVSADDIIHLYFVERPGQVRGIPRGASVVLKLRDFDDAQDAFLMMQKIASCFTVFVTESDLGDSLDENGNDDDLPTEVEPGLITKLGRGQQVSFGSPPAVQGYADFSKITIRSISRGYGVPVELLDGDYSNLNFSSGKMSWTGFHRNIEMMRWITIIPRLCRRIWSWFDEAATISAIKTDGATSTWTPPRREMIDALQEYKALGFAVRMGFMSLPEAIRQLGYEPEEVLNEQAEAITLLDKLGLVVDSDPRKTTQGGMFQQDSNQGDSGA